MRRALAALGLWLVVAPGALRAQPEVATRDLTLDDALAQARRANRSLVVERARLAQAQANLDQAWSGLFPTIALQGKYGRNNKAAAFPLGNSGVLTTIQPLNQFDGTVSASMPLLVPYLFPGIESVKVSLRASEADFDASEDGVLFGVAQTFYACAVADEVRIARHSNVEVARVTLQNARTRFAAGAVTKVDVDRAELALVRSQQAEREAELAREQSYRSLGTLIEAQGPFQVRVPPSATPAPPAVQDLDVTLRLRPEFRALQATAQTYDAQARVFAWRWAPSLSAFGNAHIFNYENFTLEKHSWVVGAQLDWVIFDGGSRNSQRHLAAAQAAEAAARAEVLRESIRDDLANGRLALETKAEAREAAERSVELARETIELVRTQYESGTVTQVDLLQAQDALVDAQQALAQAHFDVALADLTLRRAAGTFPGR